MTTSDTTGGEPIIPIPAETQTERLLREWDEFMAELLPWLKTLNNPKPCSTQRRDVLAGMAMMGMVQGCVGVLWGEVSAYAKGPCNAVITDRAVVLADRLIAALDKKREPK